MKSKQKNRKVYLFTVIAWLIFMLFYGWYYVANMMAQLAIKPDPDTYANNAGFQAIAFIFTHGLFSILVLGFILFFEACVIEKPNPSFKRDA